MRRLACAVFAFWSACDTTVYSPFSGGGDGGKIAGTTVIGGMNNPDMARPPDLSLTTTTPSGSITIHSGTQSSLAAEFADSSCLTTLAGGCLVRECPPSDMAVAGYTFNVGDIHVISPMGDVSVAPQSNGTYLPLAITGQLWTAAGAMVAVSGSGADYPAFSIMVDGPSPITVVNPLAGSFDLPRTADFEVDWTGGSVGHVTVEVSAAAKRLSCQFAVAAGSGALPGTALSALPAGPATMTIVVDSDAVVDSVISVSAEVPGLDSGGLPFSASVNLR